MKASLDDVRLRVAEAYNELVEELNDLEPAGAVDWFTRLAVLDATDRLRDSIALLICLHEPGRPDGDVNSLADQVKLAVVERPND
jgi:hypothetical protein